MYLRNLLPDSISLHANPLITGVVLRAQDVKKGDLCIILPSFQGRRLQEFIAAAERLGAAAIIVPETNIYISEKSMVIPVSNPRWVASYVAAKIFPQQPNHVVAVTGTNGKSSTVNFLNQIWAHQGILGASLGTLGLNVNSTEVFLNQNFTTPDALALHKVLDQLAQEHIHYVAMEASSHGLDQNRMDHVRVQAAGFTNLTPEHLDYHRTMEAYFNAKSILFDRILHEKGVAVLHSDSNYADPLRAICKHRDIEIIDYGRTATHIQIVDISPQQKAQECLIRIFGKAYQIKIPLVGSFQVDNVLCALGLAVGLGLKVDQVLASLELLQPIPGRLDFVGSSKNGAHIFVDYAHTPDALLTVLRMLRAHCNHELHVVFGCGGDRDTSKRPVMGEIAQNHANYVYVTDDNPRSESPPDIRKQILNTCVKGKEIPSRYDAIEIAIQNSQSGDIILIAGKGHETYQIYGDLRYDFDDRAIVQEILDKGY